MERQEFIDAIWTITDPDLPVEQQMAAVVGGDSALNSIHSVRMAAHSIKRGLGDPSAPVHAAIADRNFSEMMPDLESLIKRMIEAYADSQLELQKCTCPQCKAEHAAYN